MKDKILTIGIMLVLLIVGLCGCTENNEENSFIGTWAYESSLYSAYFRGTYNFYENGNVIIENSIFEKNLSWSNYTFFGTYSLSQNILTILYKTHIATGAENSFQYEFNNDELTLTKVQDPTDILVITRERKLPPLEIKEKDGTTVIGSIDTFCLTADDLPIGYIECSNDSEPASMFITVPIESYIATFSNGNCSNMTEKIECGIYKFDTLNDASIAYNFTRFFSTLVASGMGQEEFTPVSDSYNRIGDESFSYSMISDSNIDSFYYFRVSNVLVLLSMKNKEYTFASNLAEIVEQRILDSFN